MAYMFSRNRKHISKYDKHIIRAEGIYDDIDDVKDRIGRILAVDLPDGSVLFYDDNRTREEIEADIDGRYAIGIAKPLR